MESKNTKAHTTTGRQRCPDFAQLIREQPPGDALFEQIVACFSKWLESIALYTCRDETLAKDAFQEAMLAVSANLHGYRGEAPIEPWLKKIVFTSCSRLRRGKKNDPKINLPMEVTELSKPLTDGGPDQERQLMLRQAFGDLVRIVDTLDEPNRSLLVLHDSGEKSVAELATQYEMTDEGVKSRLKRARAAVRKQLLAL